MLFRVPITDLLSGSFFAGGALVTIVVFTLVSLDSLLLLALPRRALGAGAAAAAFFGLPTAEVPVLDAPVAARPGFALSVGTVAAPLGWTNLIGDVGRTAMLVGGLIGDRGTCALRGFAERGERTWSACLVRDATRA
jgi:hypothetical protein